jgi:hypothetical protein
MTINRKLADYAADVPATIGSAGQVLKVNSGATAYEWQDIGDTLPSGAAAGQALLRNSGNTAYEWGTIATGTADVSYPADWASPTNTYSTSGTWSKGSLADDDYVWFFLLNGGGGGSSYSYGGGSGGVGGYYPNPAGTAVLLYGKAAVFDGGTYTIGAGGASVGSGGGAGNAGGTTTFAFASSLGLATISKGNAVVGSSTFSNTDLILHIVAPHLPTSSHIEETISTPYTFATGPQPANTAGFLVGGARGWNSNGTSGPVFAGGAGGGIYTAWGNYFDSTSTVVSLLSGNGGRSNANGAGANGTYPGGGGGSGRTGGGSGANGNVRVYHV